MTKTRHLQTVPCTCEHCGMPTDHPLHESPCAWAPVAHAHPAYDPDYCPLCGTARVIGQ